MPCVHMMEGHARQHSARELSSRLPPCRVPPSSAALTLLDCEKTILRAACGGQVAHVSIHIMRQEGCGRGGSVVRAEAWHSVSVQSARRLWQTYPMKLDWYRTRRGTVKISVVSRCHAEALRREQHGDFERLRSTQQDHPL